MADLAAHPRRTMRWWWWLLLLAGLPLAAMLDAWAHRHAFISYGPFPDYYYLFRIFGYWQAWLLGALVIYLLESRDSARKPEAKRRAGLIVLIPGFAGLAAIILKIFVRRLRPTAPPHDTLRFRPFSENLFSGSGLTFPSEHAAVAFAAAIVLSRFYPRAACVWWGWAIGCGVTRIVSRGHYVSDVYGSLIVALAVATAAFALIGRRSRGVDVNRSR